MRLHAIAAVSENYCIGIDGRLPWNAPSDLENFKRLTIGKSIIMGRGCYESIGRPLPDRNNIVLTRSDIEIPGCTVAHAIDTAILYGQHFSDDIFVIGGQDIYEEFLPLCSDLHLTRINVWIDGDRYFPQINHSQWKCIERIDLANDGYECGATYYHLTRK